MPQAPPGAHDAALKPLELTPPLSLEAKVDIFLETLGLPHSGQLTSLIALELRTSSSKG
ncbi:MAG: hypothetical protein M5U05_06145 [Anaerolineales bacterium]|jgi:hypothetical protein|nr:hypothetical protein [Anaerolineales bacterium]